MPLRSGFLCAREILRGSEKASVCGIFFRSYILKTYGFVWGEIALCGGVLHLVCGWAWEGENTITDLGV